MRKHQGFTPHFLRKGNLFPVIERRSRSAGIRRVKNARIMESAGFTLIELLVVISIIGTLATLSVVSLNNARAKARDARRISDIRQIQTALELYYFDHDGYPAGTAELGEGDFGCLGNGGFTALGSACPAAYMRYIPGNPGPNGSPYDYTSVGGDGYSITFSLESGAGGLLTGAHTADQDGVQ